MAGMEVVFDWCFDGGAWPGPAVSSFGQAWLGPQGLLGRLELELGLTRRHVAPIDRAVALSRVLGHGFWSASLAVDPIATARRLLEDRDLLVAWGWRGEAVSDRLDALWEATKNVHPGIPDRVASVLEQVAHDHVDLGRITCCEPVENYPPIWRSLFRALRRRGVEVAVSEPDRSAAGGDLGAARASAFGPTGDGSLQLIRPQGALAAADAIAAAVATAADDGSTLIVTPDAVLDGALRRHGVPRVGADPAAPGSAALLRACIETAFYPVDTSDLHALVCAEPGPVPRNVAWALSNALGRFASRGSAEWHEGLRSQLAVLSDDARTQVAERLTMLLSPIAYRSDRIETARVIARLEYLESWARGRGLDELATRTNHFARLLRGTVDASRNELLRLCDELECPTASDDAGEVGLASVIHPGAIVGAVGTVIWWGFTRDRAPSAPRLRLSNAERAALGDAAPDLGAIMAAEARRWRRPLDLAAQALILVCPRTDAVGDAAHPHPLWDELVAAMPDSSLQYRLERERPDIRGPAGRRAVPVRPLPMPFTAANAPASLALREPESASSLAELIGCSLAYVLRYGGRVRPRLAAAPVEPGPLLYGNVAHHVLALVFADGPASEADAVARAGNTFDEELVNVAEPLLLPDFQAERAMLRRAVVESARFVARVLHATGAGIRGLEHVVAGRLGPATVESRADLVLQTPNHVIDFKWGMSAHREALRNGAAVQLAIYAALVGRGTGAAFMSLRDQSMFAARGSRLSLATETGGYSVDDMATAVVHALEVRARELAEGRLAAPGALDEDVRSRIDAGVLQLAPGCEYCQHGALCGKRGRA